MARKKLRLGIIGTAGISWAHRNGWREIADLARAVLKGEKGPVPVEQTLDVIRIPDRIYRSTQMKREVKV